MDPLPESGQPETKSLDEVCRAAARFGFAYVRTSRDGRLEVVSPPYEKLTGRPRNELLGAPVTCSLPLEWEDEQALNRLVLHGGAPIEVNCEIGRRAGEPRRVRMRAVPLPGGGVEAMVREVAEGELERELAESRDRYRALFEGANAAIFIADAETGVLLDVNTDAERLVGRSRATLVGMHQADLHPPDEVERYLEMFRKHVSMDRVVSVEAAVIRSDGTRVPVAIYGSQSMLGGRRCQIGVFHDLTEQKRSEEAMRQQDALRQAIVDHAAEGIIVCHASEDGCTVQFSVWNDRMVEMTGYRMEEINELGWFSTMWPDAVQQEHAREQFQRVHDGAILHGDVREVVRKDGEHRLLSFSASRIEGASGRGAVLALVSDMTDRERMLGRLRQSEKMEAIGQLAGGIAHDMNNQLAGILGLADLMVRDLANAGLQDQEAAVRRTERRARQVADICVRARDVTQQLLAYARRGRYQTVAIDVREVVRQVVSLLSHSIDKRIELVVTSTEEAVVVRADPTQLQSALLNIALNARDAMPTGGSITFSVSVGAPLEGTATESAVIEVKDTGTGMSEATRVRVFEPFFTTKPPGKGTGMGLAAVYGTVKNHGGRVEVDSALGKGTTFRVWLPRHVQEAGRTEASEVRSSARSHHARILVVDDEQLVRETMAEMLRELGHQVTTCEDGGEALGLFRQRWREFDLVVLDMVMPKRGGHEVFREMLTVNPHVRVLLISGHSVDLEARETLALGAAGFLQKPFSLDALVKVVDQLLARSPSTKNAP
jgi:PAS domain S-box-containing protein